MNETATWENQELSLVSDESATSSSADDAASNDRLSVLKSLAVALLKEAQALEEVPSLDIRQGIDFYDEVRRFEIDLIKRALECTRGHQVRAARLLNLKVTTLNSKIKHYNINGDVLASGYAFPTAAENGAHQQA